MRLEGQIKKGYYPLPMSAVPAICKALSVSPKATIYDPCAGEGVAIKAIAEGLGLPADRVFASELDIQRSQKATEYLVGSTVYSAVDFISDRVWGSPSIVYCNPPFSHEMGGGRTEHSFISRVAHLLDPGGIAIFVLPEGVAMNYNTYELLSPSFHSISVHAVPGERPYKETVIFGVKRRILTQVDWHSRPRTVQDWSVVEKAGLFAGPGSRVFAKKQDYTDEEYQELLSASSINSILDIQAANKTKALRPPMELTHGHVALLLASGFLDGVVAKPGELPHVVRGSTRKVVETKTEKTDTGSREIQVEHIQLTVKVATMDGVVQLSDRLQTEAAEGESDNV